LRELASIEMFSFLNQFREDDPKTDPNLAEKLSTPEELSGIFNWALEGLKRLLKNGRFSNSKTIEEVREYYMRATNSQMAYSQDLLEEIPQEEEDANLVYSKYVLWCREHQVVPISKIPFNVAFTQHVPMAVAAYVIGPETNVRKKVWRNVRFKEDDGKSKSDSKQREKERLKSSNLSKGPS
jgi:phage/plasmid-associated DNA primase